MTQFDFKDFAENFNNYERISEILLPIMDAKFDYNKEEYQGEYTNYLGAAEKLSLKNHNKLLCKINPYYDNSFLHCVLQATFKIYNDSDIEFRKKLVESFRLGVILQMFKPSKTFGHLKNSNKNSDFYFSVLFNKTLFNTEYINEIADYFNSDLYLSYTYFNYISLLLNVNIKIYHLVGNHNSDMAGDYINIIQQITDYYNIYSPKPKTINLLIDESYQYHLIGIISGNNKVKIAFDYNDNLFNIINDYRSNNVSNKMINIEDKLYLDEEKLEIKEYFADKDKLLADIEKKLNNLNINFISNNLMII